MKKLSIVISVVFLAVMAVFSSAKASEEMTTTEWTYYSHYKCEVLYEYVIKKHYPSQKIWLEVNNYEGRNSFSLGKAEYIGISDVKFNNESSVLSLIYELNSPSYPQGNSNYYKGPFLVVVKPGKVPQFYKIKSPRGMSIVSHVIFKNKAYVELKKAGGQSIGVYDLEDKSFRTTVLSYTRYANVIFGERRKGEYESHQNGVVVGITPIVNPWNDPWVNEPPSVVTIFDADTGEVITEKPVDANTKVSFIQYRLLDEDREVIYLKKQTYCSEVYEQ